MTEKTNEKPLLDELADRLAEAARATPAADLERNLRALLLSAFDRLDLVTREDFDVQRRLLARAQQRLAELESRLEELEARPASGDDR